MAERDARAARKKLIWRVVQILISVVLVVAIFAYAIPKIADYRSVWQAFTSMTWLELTSLVVATVFNLFTYWWQNMASIPGLGLWQAAVNNQTTTSIADTIPGGGYIAVGVGYTMYRSWGFPTSVIALSALVTGIWNVFMKLGLPVIALAILAVAVATTASPPEPEGAASTTPGIDGGGPEKAPSWGGGFGELSRASRLTYRRLA